MSIECISELFINIEIIVNDLINKLNINDKYNYKYSIHNVLLSKWNEIIINDSDIKIEQSKNENGSYPYQNLLNEVLMNINDYENKYLLISLHNSIMDKYMDHNVIYKNDIIRNYHNKTFKDQFDKKQNK